MNVKTPIAIAGLAVAGGLMLTGCGALVPTATQSQPSQAPATQSQPAKSQPAQSNAPAAPAPPASPAGQAPATAGNGAAANQPAGSNSGRSSGTHQCTSGDVSGSFGPVAISNAASSGTSEPNAHPVYTYIKATNTSDSTCTIDGFGGLDMLTGGDGHNFNVKLTRMNTYWDQPKLITLAPGQSAYKLLDWATTNNDGDSSPNVDDGVSWAVVTLPNDTKQFEAWPANRDKGLPNIVDNTVDGYAWSTQQPNPSEDASTH